MTEQLHPLNPGFEATTAVPPVQEALDLVDPNVAIDPEIWSSVVSKISDQAVTSPGFIEKSLGFAPREAQAIFTALQTEGWVATQKESGRQTYAVINKRPEFPAPQSEKLSARFRRKLGKTVIDPLMAQAGEYADAKRNTVVRGVNRVTGASAQAAASERQKAANEVTEKQEAAQKELSANRRRSRLLITEDPALLERSRAASAAELARLKAEAAAQEEAREAARAAARGQRGQPQGDHKGRLSGNKSGATPPHNVDVPLDEGTEHETVLSTSARKPRRRATRPQGPPPITETVNDYSDEYKPRNPRTHRRATRPAGAPETTTSPNDPGDQLEEALLAEREPMDKDLVLAAIELVGYTQFGSTPMVNRRLGVSADQANRLMGELERLGIVGPAEGERARAVLIPPERVDELLRRLRNLYENATDK
ncbi:MAG: DNA translocase FtsK [Candidatus Saccharimonadales bacterium]